MTSLVAAGVRLAMEWLSGVDDRRARSWFVLALALTACTPTGDLRGEAPRTGPPPRAAVASIAVTPDVPDDIPGGAPEATLAEAARFAWQEFIALSWPAAKSERGVPDRTARLGAGGPVVWESYRHKAEVFPGYGPPAANGSDSGDPKYSYDPSNVGAYSRLAAGSVPACSGVESLKPPLINLDEATEIGFDSAFARPRTERSEPRQILFLAKVNPVYFRYVHQRSWFLIELPPLAKTAAYVAARRHSPPPGSTDLVSFPSGTIEAKAAWRRLTPDEAASGRFYTAPVRFYQPQDAGGDYGGDHRNGAVARTCYVDAPAGTWGLIGLHINHKTPTAPYFTYATFEQADNLLDPSGAPLEDPTGRIVGALAPTAFEPDIASRNATGGAIATPASVQALTVRGGGPQSRYGLQFVNNPAAPSTPQGPIHINQRMHPIPPAIVAINREAQDALRRYDRAAPWQYYKLVNVQHRPLDKPTPGVDYTGDDRATYYQANIVVESDYNLQRFSGSFQPGTQSSGNTVTSLTEPVESKNIDNLITDFWVDGTVFKNVQYQGASYNMGGCMGCHGNIQRAGADFSFLLFKGPVHGPSPMRQSLDYCAPAIASEAASHGVCGAVCGTAGLPAAGEWSCQGAPARTCAAAGSGACVCRCRLRP